MDAAAIQGVVPIVLVLLVLGGLYMMTSFMSLKTVISSVVIVGLIVLWAVNNVEMPSLNSVMEEQGVSIPNDGGVSELEKLLDNPFIGR